MIKLDANENPYRPPADLCAKLADFSRGLAYNRYPDKTYRKLRESLALYSGWPAEKIIAGNGSDELILLLLLAYGGPDSKLITVEPTFTMYNHYAQATKTALSNIFYNKQGARLTFPKAEVEQAIENCQQGIIFLCSPNNPTGEIRSRQWLEDILTATELPVVVDEAYYEFSGNTAKELLADHDNLIILRTLSKAFGMAGLRVGYLLAGRDICNMLEDLRSPYNINRFSAGAAEILLQAQKHYQACWEKIKEGREWLYRELEAREEIIVFPSQANYLLWQTDKLSEEKVYQSLLTKGIKVRYWEELPLFGQALRVSVGQQEENQKFINSLDEIIKEVR